MRGRFAIAVICALLVCPAAASAQAQQPGHAEHAKEAPKSDAPVTPSTAARETKPADEHAGHVTSSPAAVPPPTDEDRAAAFPDVAGHTVHDNAVNYFVLFDQMEWQPNDGRRIFNGDTKGWLGGDINRLWFRTEGAADSSGIEDADAHLFYGRAISRWWDLIAGVRQDVRPGPGRTWAAFGIQGLAPYWFEIEATGYFGEGGRTHARFEAEYDLLFTNRLILQPLVEVELYGRSDPERGIGAGFSTAETGIRLRYEIRRELAPYVGFTWQRKLGGTAELAGGQTGSARVMFGLRTWF